MNHMKSLLLFLVLVSISTYSIIAQGTAGESAKYEYRMLIDMPTAGILEKGNVSFSTDMLPNGSVMVKLEAGIFESINFGLSYGGSNIIGSGDPDWYPFPPGVNLRFRLMDETILVPAITIGFDTQGKGEYFENDDRYTYKAPGFFAAASKNFALLGYLSLHGTVNYAILEGDDGDNFLNIGFGAEKTLGSQFSVAAEYNFAFNDNSTDFYGSGKGYLNLGFRWSFGPGFTFGLDLRDLLQNKDFNPNAADRGLFIGYIQKI
jgi:hypothetical protein